MTAPPATAAEVAKSKPGPGPLAVIKLAVLIGPPAARRLLALSINPVVVGVIVPPTSTVLPNEILRAPVLSVKLPATRLPPAMATVPAPPALFTLTSPLPAVLLELTSASRLPVTVSTPLCVILAAAPPAVTLRLPETVDAPRSISLASRKSTLLPLLIFTVEKLLVSVLSVMLLAAPASKVVILPTPETSSVPLWVMVPFAVTFRFPDTVDAPRMMASTVSRITTSLPLLILTVAKLLPAVANVTLLPAPASNVAVLPAPATSTAPLCEIVPLEVTLRLPLIVDVPRTIAVASLSNTSLPLPIAIVPKSLVP